MVHSSHRSTVRASLHSIRPIRRAICFAVEALECRTLLSAPVSWSASGTGGGGALFSPSFSTSNPNELYVATDMGELFHSTNLGQTWTYPSQVASANGVQAGPLSQVQFTNNPNIVYTLDYTALPGSVDSVVPAMSTDGGNTWHDLSAWNTTTGDNQAYSIFADPNNSSRIIVSDYSDIWYSTNSGASFTKVYSNSNGVYMAGMFWDPNEQNIYIGTSVGLIESTNGGSSFGVASISGIPAGEAIKSFAGAESGGVTRLYAITWNSGDVFPGMVDEDTPQSFMNAYSLTVGQSAWTSITNNIAPDYPFFIATFPTDINTVYVAGTDGTASNPTVEKSTNAGGSWTNVFITAGNQNITTAWEGQGGDKSWGFDQEALGFAISPDNENELAITGYGFIHISTNGGTSWTQVYENPSGDNPAGQNTPDNQAYQTNGLVDTSALWLTFSNQNANDLFAGYTDVTGWSSSDGGSTWSFPDYNGDALNTTYQVSQVAVGTTGTIPAGTMYAAESSIHDLYQSTRVNNSILDTGTGSVLISSNGGSTWTLLHNFGHPVVYTALDPTDPNRMYVSVVDGAQSGGNYIGGIYVTNNLNLGTGATWTELPAPPRTQGHAYNVDVLNDGTVVASFSGTNNGSGFTDSSGVFSYNPTTQVWTDVSAPGEDYWTKDITIDPTDPTQDTWYAAVRSGYGNIQSQGLGGLYRTTNRGLTWTLIFSTDNVESVAINPATGEMYVSTLQDGLYYSADPHDATPVFTQTDYPFRQPERVFFNPNDPSQVWVTSFGWGVAVGTSAVANNAVISGNAFDDINGNGIKDTGDNGIQNVQIYIDANNTGSFVVGDPTTMTDSSGNYSFTGLAAGNYVVREVLPAGYTQTAPAGDFYAVTLAAGQTAANENFGDEPIAGTVSIAGNVFNDLNGNGILDAGEYGLADVQVYLDINNSGSFVAGDPTTNTDPSGNYSFAGLAAGSYIVRETTPANFTQTAPANGSYSLTLTSEQTDSNEIFGDKSNPDTITLQDGTVFVTGTNSSDTIAGGLDPGDASQYYFLIQNASQPTVEQFYPVAEVTALQIQTDPANSSPVGADDDLVNLGGDNFGFAVSVNGGAGSDTVIGQQSPNDITTGVGSSHNLIYGSIGADSLLSLGSDDTMRSGGGADTIRANAGNNILVGGKDGSQMYAGAGHDTLRSGRGNATLHGGAGGSLLLGGFGNDMLEGGNGDDTLIAGSGQETLIAGSANDFLDAGWDAYLILQGGGLLPTAAGTSDVIDGASGINDTLVSSAGSPTITGGSGTNVYSVNNPAADLTNVQNGEFVAQNDTVASATQSLLIHLTIQQVNQGVTTQALIPAGAGAARVGTSTAFTTDANGTVVFQSNGPRTFTLADFFNHWGVNFSSAGIGQFIASAGSGHSISMTVNGVANANFQNYQVQNGDNIVITFTQ